MTAPRPVVAPPRAEGRTTSARHLRVVPDRRRRPVGVVAVAALVLVFGVLLCTAALNTVLVSGQRDLDRIERDIAEGRRQNQALHLQQAELESPTRIVEEARRTGMVVPDEVTWITPSADGGSDAETTPRTTAPDEPSDGGPGGDAPVDERADAALGGP